MQVQQAKNRPKAPAACFPQFGLTDSCVVGLPGPVEPTLKFQNEVEDALKLVDLVVT